MLDDAMLRAHSLRRTDPADDRCAHYIPKANGLNFHRCVSCLYFDPETRHCLYAEEQQEPVVDQGSEHDDR